MSPTRLRVSAQTQPGERDSLPRHDDLGALSRAVEVASLAAAGALVLAHVVRLAAEPLSWWTPPLVLAGMVAADFVSGLIHWAADTWGKETLPVLGPRFLRPFRVHHVNPDDILRRDFIDANGDVAMIALPFLAAAFLLPPAGAVFL